MPRDGLHGERLSGEDGLENLRRPQPPQDYVEPRFRGAVVGMAIASVVAARAAVLVPRIQTGSDESLHLMRTLDWLGRMELTSDGAHRMRGISVLLLPLVAAAGDPTVYRAAFAVLGLAACCLTYAIARHFLDRWVAAWCALMLAAWSATITTSIQILPDLPSALFILLAMLLYWRSAVARAPNEPLQGLPLVALALGIAFWFNMAYPALAAVVVGLDMLLWRRREIFGRQVLAAGATAAAVLLPYFVGVWINHGSPLATLRIGLAGSDRLGGPIGDGDPGYVTYTRWLFESEYLFPPLVGAALLGCVLLVVFAAISGKPIPRRHASLLAMWAIFPPVALALLFHAEVRYLWMSYPAFFLTFGVAAAAARAALARAPVAAMALLGAVLFAFGVTQFRIADRNALEASASNATIHDAAHELARVARPPCSVWTRHPREMTLITQCSSRRFGAATADTILADARRFPGQTYVVIYEGVEEARQPAFVHDLLATNGTLVARLESRSALGASSTYRLRP